MLYSAILYALPRLSDESMALYHNWDVKNDFAYALQFSSLISDGLGSVSLQICGIFKCMESYWPVMAR